MTPFNRTSISKYGDEDDVYYFAILNCAAPMRRYVENVAVPDFIIRYTFPDGDRTEFNFIGDKETLEVFREEFAFNYVVTLGEDKKTGFLNIRHHNLFGKRLIVPRAEFDGVKAIINAHDSRVFRLIGNVERLNTFREWYDRRFTDSCGY